MDKLKTLNSNTFRYKPLDSYMREYFQKTHIDYVYMLSGNSINANLYKLNTEFSSVSDGANTSLEYIGKNSPYIFDKIEKVPIYNCTSVDIPLGWNEDSGYSTELRLECIVPPSNLNIEVDDYLVLLYSDYSNLWKVTEASPSTFEGIYYTKLSLLPTPYSSDDIEYQVKKRYSFVFESGTVLDINYNKNLNDILETLDNYYRNFLGEFYCPQQVFLDKEVYTAMHSKYFKLLDISTDYIILNYFFKKYISSTIITYSIDVKLSIENLINYNGDILDIIEKDSSKILLSFIKLIESGKKPSDSLYEAIDSFEYYRKEQLKENPVEVLKELESPYKNILLEEDKDYYDLLIETLRLLESGNGNNDMDFVKLFANLKKLLKYVKIAINSENSIINSFFLFFIFKGISFKNIHFTNTRLEYGE